MTVPFFGLPSAGPERRIHRFGLEYTDICDRVEVERKFSVAKRKCGIGLIMTKLRITTVALPHSKAGRGGGGAPPPPCRFSVSSFASDQ